MTASTHTVLIIITRGGRASSSSWRRSTGGHRWSLGMSCRSGFLRCRYCRCRCCCHCWCLHHPYHHIQGKLCIACTRSGMTEYTHHTSSQQDFVYDEKLVVWLWSHTKHISYIVFIWCWCWMWYPQHVSVLYDVICLQYFNAWPVLLHRCRNDAETTGRSGTWLSGQIQ